MTALYMDGFDHYGTGGASIPNMLAGTWATTVNGVGTPPFAARTGTNALTLATAGGVNRWVLPATKAKVFMSFGYAVNNLPIGNRGNIIVTILDNTNAPICSLWATSTGSLELTNGAGSTVLASTQGPILVPSNWHFIELEYDQAGNFIVRVDDPTGGSTPAINASGLTFASPAAQLGFNYSGFGGGAATSWMDDLFIRDGLGTVNNAFLGDRRIATLLANGDTTTAGWSANRYFELGAGILNNTATTNHGAVVFSPTATALNIGNSDFTLETFVRFQSLPTGSNKAVIFSRWDPGANTRSYQLFLGSQALNNGSLCFQTSTDGTNTTVAQSIVYPWTPNLNTWYHIAMVRSAGQLLLFVNGQQFGLPINDASTYFAGTAPFGIGGESIVATPDPTLGSVLTGWFDETRFTNGFARYTANFTPTLVEFPRNIGGDSHFAQVVLLAGYDTVLQDESSFARTMTAFNGATQQTVLDAPTVGVYPVIGKSVPDDNTFIQAPFVAATGILTLTANPANGNTVTVGTKAAATPAVYTFKTVLASAFDVLIDTTIANTLQNLFNAINAGPGAGTKYGTATTSNLDVNALQLPAGQMKVVANAAGTGGNSIPSTSSGITGSWSGATLSGGLNIPGPSNFKVQRLPPTTTLVSAVQINTRSFKSDAGVGSFNSALIGPLGGVSLGPTHSLTVSPVYYDDIYEIDPDTSGPISPTTITNGSIQINRDT